MNVLLFATKMHTNFVILHKISTFYTIFKFEFGCSQSLWLLHNDFILTMKIFALCFSALLNIWIEQWTQAILSFTFTHLLKHLKTLEIPNARTRFLSSIHFLHINFQIGSTAFSVSMLNAYGSFCYFPTAIYTFAKLSAHIEQMKMKKFTMKIAWRTASMAWWVKIIRKTIKKTCKEITKKKTEWFHFTIRL